MSTMKRIITMLSALVLILAGACSTASAAGSWQLKEIRDDGSGLLITEANLTAMGEYSMELKEDGSGTMNMGGAVSQVQWDEKAITIAGGSPQTYTLQGKELKLQDEEAVLTFVRE